MNSRNLLLQQAIQAAKDQNWEKAIQINLELIDMDPKDTGAHNRLAMSFLQQGDKKKAVKEFKSVIKLDPSNQIAKKHLEKLEKNQVLAAPMFANNHFIEEPGKTKSVMLNRLASRNILATIGVGVECTLKPKNRYISIEVGNQYLGALPEDISFRLTKLLNHGNEYSCYVRTVTASTCEVFLKEEKRSKKNEYVNSFPINPGQVTAINDLDDAFLTEDVPVQIVETDSDSERSYDEISIKDSDEEN